MTLAHICQISGPVLRAKTADAFQLREAVRVGDEALLGEVIRIEQDEITVQVYEDTTGLRPGVKIEGSGRPLSIRLGPGLLGNIFDGLLRPLDPDSRYVRPGLHRAPARTFAYTALLRTGQHAAGGTAFGQVGSAGGRIQLCLLPPGVSGEIVTIAADGNYAEDAPLCRVRGENGMLVEVAMSHDWPVRVPRPAKARVFSDQPLFTGQRIIDALFPVVRGGKAALPGGFGTGKTVLLESLAKWCDADIIVYLGCGERGNEMAGVLDEFPKLQDPRSGRPLMERMVVIANTSNMPVAAREASIYSAATVAEYFRDQGLHVALMADSTSRWAEALREVSGRFGELPGEGGYPAYLASRIADFYERAAQVETLGGARGSVTIMGSISPPSGDFSEPVTSHTKRYVRSFWALDAKRAQARFYPAINPLQSYTEGVQQFVAWWARHGNDEWETLRRKFLTLLEEQARLERMARIIGKDALPLKQQLVLLCAELVNEAFLRQSAYSENDRYASPARQSAMMKLLGRFLVLAEQAVNRGLLPERLAQLAVFRRLQRMGEEIGEQPQRFSELAVQLEQEFNDLLLTAKSDSNP